MRPFRWSFLVFASLFVAPILRADDTVIEVAAADSHVLLLKSNHLVYTEGGYGFFSGTYFDVVSQVTGIDHVGTIGANNQIDMAWRSDTGGVFRWGRVPTPFCRGTDDYGINVVVGNFPPGNPEVILPNVKKVVPGVFFQHALLGDGRVFHWGIDIIRPCHKVDPSPVDGLPTTITSFAGGDFQLLAVDGGGSVWSWGGNGFGELGNGTTTDNDTPTVVAGLASVKQVGAGGRFSLALKNDGTLWSWGRNNSGQLGICQAGDQYHPVQVPLTNVSQIFVGANTTFAKLTNGQVWGWGLNAQGQLGDGTLISKNCPEHLANFDNAIMISPGTINSYAITPDGNVVGVGPNTLGQLGNIPPPNYLTPPPPVTTPHPISGNPGQNSAPTFAQDITVTTPVSIAGGKYIANVSVLGADPESPESALTYTYTGSWTGTGSIVFGSSGRNESKNTTVTFGGTGNYIITVIVKDPQNARVQESITVHVQPGGVADAAPTFSQAASATPPSVTGTTTDLSSLATDADDAESTLIYIWTASGPGSVTFNANGTHDAQNTRATFTRVGPYTFTVTARDPHGATATSSVAVTVSATLGGITVSPSVVSVAINGNQSFTAAGVDQFGATMAATGLSWSVSGGGTIDANGLFHAGTQIGGPHTVTAQKGSFTDTAQISVVQNAPPTVTLVSPTNNALVVLGNSISLQATASATGATITRVEFLDGATVLSSVTNAPYTFEWFPSHIGTYHISARATDSNNATGVSAIAIVTVQIAVPVLNDVTPSAKTEQDDAFVMDVSGSQFDPSTLLLWNGAVRLTDFVDSTHLKAHILSDDLRVPGFYPLSLSSSGGPSVSSLSFEVVSRVDKVEFVNLGSIVPLSASIKAVAQQGTAASYQFTFTPKSAQAGSLSATGARAGGFSAASSDGTLALRSVQSLTAGSYHVSATAQNRLGQVSAPAEADITVVGSDLNQARIYPNPYRSDRYTNNQITFDRLTLNSTVKIFTVSGQAVKKLDASSGAATWDLTTESGDRAASGIYLYLITNDHGQKAKGKFAIIH